MELATARTFFGWCTLINWAMLAFTALFVISARNWVYKKHSKFFPISEESFNVAIYWMVGFYKVLVIMLFFVPWLALVIMTR